MLSKFQFVFLLVLSLPFFAKAQTHRLKKAIICLTYDDGLETQLTTVTPIGFRWIESDLFFKFH
jgi:hypothetical protein